LFLATIRSNELLPYFSRNTPLNNAYCLSEAFSKTFGMSILLPFHKSIIEKIHDPATSDLLILARGLGLRRIICTLMKIYDSPQNLVLLVNATPEEESAIGEELGIMGCRRPGLRVVGYETGGKDRCVHRMLWKACSYPASHVQAEPV